MDCGFHAVDSRFQITMELGLWIEIVSGIPDSLRVILDSSARDPFEPRKVVNFSPELILLVYEHLTKA